MTCNLHCVSDAHLFRMLNNPPLVLRLLAPDDAHDADAETEATRPGLLARIFRRNPDHEEANASRLVLSDSERYEADIDKAWHGIHYCLNGTALDGDPPMDFLTTGGTAVGDVDVGYGPARGFYSDEVLEIYDRIVPMYRAALRTHYDPEKMAALDIYPDIWSRDGEAGFDYLAEHFGTLKQFVTHCVQHQHGMVVYLS